ncbi:MAG: Ig-like domain-containing protein [Alicyclobacillus sp.]|nr:Ig-like domain-containing protein [Alicyclobacillus sp.]
MKRTLTGVIAATVVLGTAIPMAFADSTYGPYSDTSGNQYATAINVMSNAGVVHGYADGTYDPTGDLSRGQAIAYVYNILNNEGLITKHYTEKVQPYSDENNYFRNQINDMYLYGYLNNLDLGNGAIGQNWTTPKPWLAQLLCNVAGVSYDPSKPWDALNKARAAGWFDNTNDKTALGDTDKNGSKYYISRAEFAQVLENFYKAQFPNSKVLAGQVTDLSVSAKSNTVQVGQADQLSVTGTDLSGNTQNVDLSKVTFTVSPSDTGFVNSAGNFTATAPGTYTITATDGALTASTKVTVYGQPASLSMSAAGDLVADQANSSTMVTVKVLDANGNVVTNYNGPVTLASNNTNDASIGSTTATTSQTVNAVNGVATFTVYSLPASQAGDSATLTASIPGTNVTGTGSVKVDAPVATSFSIGYAQNQPNGLAVNFSNSQTAIQVTVKDQAGNKMPNYNGWATVSISGPATLLGSSTTSENVWIAGGVSNPIYIAGKQGVTGTVVVTVSAPGLSDGSFQIPAYNQTGVASLVATVDTSVIGSGGYATVTVKELDSNGNLAVIKSDGNANNNPIQVSQDSGSSNVIITNAKAASGQTPTGVNSVTLSRGQATFYVYNNGYVGSANLKLSDGLLSTVVPLTFTTGTATKIVPLVDGVYASPGSTVTETFQLEDPANKAVAVAGKTFNVSATGNGVSLSSTTGTTDANGRFTVQITLPSNASADYTVSASPVDQASGISGATATIHTRNLSDLATSVTGYVYYNGQNQPFSGIQSLVPNGLPAGDSVYLDAWGLNAVGQIVSNVTDQFTVTSNNPNVVGINSLGNGTATISGQTTTVIPTSGPDSHTVALVGGLAGTATITVTDTSVASKPSYSFNVTVASQPKPAKLVVEGLSSGQVVQAGQTYPITLRLTDAGGNPTFLQSGDSQVNILATDQGTVNGQTVQLNDFRSAATGYTTNQTSIPTFGNYATIYWTAPASGTTNITLTFVGQYTDSNGQSHTFTASVNSITSQ